jgi:hypothetical protein
MSKERRAEVAGALGLTEEDLTLLHRLHAWANDRANGLQPPDVHLRISKGELIALRGVFSHRFDEPGLSSARAAAAAILTNGPLRRRFAARNGTKGAVSPLRTRAVKRPRRTYTSKEEVNLEGRAWRDSIFRRWLRGDDGGE